MIKFLLIVLLFIIIIFRVGGMVIRMFFGSPSDYRNVNGKDKRHANINKNQPTKSKKEGYKGGEYIDYEEVD